MIRAALRSSTAPQLSLLLGALTSGPCRFGLMSNCSDSAFTNSQSALSCFGFFSLFTRFSFCDSRVGSDLVDLDSACFPAADRRHPLHCSLPAVFLSLFSPLDNAGSCTLDTAALDSISAALVCRIPVAPGLTALATRLPRGNHSAGHSAHSMHPRPGSSLFDLVLGRSWPVTKLL